MLKPGDVVFYSRGTESTDFCDAVEKVVPDNTYYHVAIVSERGTIVEATGDGVLEYSLQKSIEENRPGCLEILEVANCCEKVLEAAATWSWTKLGLPYNDLFAADLINSDGKESYYCSQLITAAFEFAGVDMKWPAHTLNFNDKNVNQISFWNEYFEKRGKSQVPQGEEGSHPAQLRRSPRLLLKMRIFPNLINLNSLTETKLLELSSHFVAGNHVEFPSDRKFEVIEPRSGKPMATWHYATRDQVDLTVKEAKKAQKQWAKSSWMERSEILKKTGDLLKTHCNDIAYWECISNGKPIAEAKADVLSCVDTFYFYSGIASDLLGQHVPLDASRYAYTRRLPVGVVAAIGAWNYPIQTCSWKTAPALACGNAVIYKPSPLSPVTALILAEILKSAGLPDGVFNVIQGDAETAQDLIHHDGVSKVSFTGSIPTGKKIMKACADRNIKPVTLELGGKSALIVFDDADIDSAVSCAMMANFYSQGQVCSNASKVLVHKSVLKEFTKKLVDHTQKMKIGDPLKEDTQVGSHISAEHRNKVEGYISTAIAEGATKLCGGDRVAVHGLENGFYLSPCILTGITPKMTVYREEIFGSVLLIIPFDTEDEAIKIANDTDMGLAAGLVTKDLSRSYRVSEQLNAGNVYVNTYNDVSPLVPFGGVGESGFGRENGTAVLEHYTHLKSVFVNTGTCPNPF
ncbi:Aldehyde dehydrogenase domain-containing protein [Caenorhabditis elegans]|uniref:Aldehyde dehydrogenase domain-containing protein n=2 Tax=Caenorhabditis elegans TaxID=6239 RepID=Q20352_CAEEL|nr:Aldehyde dehydrogenase domain-containing protein [Caenorhabditis elegans]CCD61886.1 Aldehyde dehydrogenase domain-containing protein [Caenorhabditis elegans]|eukprot:NP_741082.1 ALdehyde deHydrogenase [Caenorhabditis elegans]